MEEEESGGVEEEERKGGWRWVGWDGGGEEGAVEGAGIDMEDSLSGGGAGGGEDGFREAPCHRLPRRTSWARWLRSRPPASLFVNPGRSRGLVVR